jgi:hypothetical protein
MSVNDVYERHVTWEEATALLFSGNYDHLTARQFGEKFPLKPSYDEVMKGFKFRNRISRLIEINVTEYLSVESEWQLFLAIHHMEEQTRLAWSYPSESKLPSIEILLREVPHG